MNGHKITMHAWMVLSHQRNDLFFVNVGYLIAEYEPNTIIRRNSQVRLHLNIGSFRIAAKNPLIVTKCQ